MLSLLHPNFSQSGRQPSQAPAAGHAKYPLSRLYSREQPACAGRSLSNQPRLLYRTLVLSDIFAAAGQPVQWPILQQLATPCCAAFMYPSFFPAGGQPVHEDASATGHGAGSQSPLPQATQAATPLRASQMAAYLKLHADAAVAGETAVTAPARAMGATRELLEDSMQDWAAAAAARLGYMHGTHQVAMQCAQEAPPPDLKRAAAVACACLRPLCSLATAFTEGGGASPGSAPVPSTSCL